jgi:outer membrane receptor protein involved in Fe transport
VSPALEVSGGLRLESFDDDYADTFGTMTATDDWLHTGELGASFELTAATTLYGTLSRGEKAGGVNTEASASRPFMQPLFQGFLENRLRFRTESLTSAELGIKGSYRQGRVNIRAAVFTMERDDAQLESWIWDDVNFLWVGLLDNVEGSNRGLELELDTLLGEQWTLSAAIGLLSAEVDSIVTFDLDLNEFVERRGIDQAKSPDWQASVVADWQPAGLWSGRLELRSQESVRFGYYHDGRLDGFSIVNASVARRFGNTSVRVYGRNLTDEDVAVHGLYFGNDPRKGWINETYLQYGEPRIVGVEMTHAF